MTVDSSYNVWAQTYDRDRNLTRDLDAATIRAALAGQRYRSIVEIGCGTGKNTVFLAEIADHILAVDFSEGMLEQARGKARAANVGFGTADITLPWPCPDRSADLVVCCLVLEHIEDLQHVFAEASRVLQPGGRMYISELHPFRQYTGAKAVFERDGEAQEIPAFVHHISEFMKAAEQSGLRLVELNEHWHVADEGKPPRLVTLAFGKSVE
jgi:malonyl-CoA O-methyltransferase